MHRLGHKTPHLAMRYQHAMAERDHATAERLGALCRASEATEPELVAAVLPLR
jgi:hypothetical protein